MAPSRADISLVYQSRATRNSSPSCPQLEWLVRHTMLYIKLIKELDEMRTMAFPPPYALMDSIEDAEGRGENWWVILAYERDFSQAVWVAVFTESGESRFFMDGDQLWGRWDPNHEIFIPEEGSPLDLRGRPVSLAAIEDEEEEEDAEYVESQRNRMPHAAR